MIVYYTGVLQVSSQVNGYVLVAADRAGSGQRRAHCMINNNHEHFLQVRGLTLMYNFYRRWAPCIQRCERVSSRSGMVCPTYAQLAVQYRGPQDACLLALAQVPTQTSR
jgi:hypothetical protein